VASAVTLATALVHIAAAYILSSEDKHRKYLGIGGGIINLAVIIWGSIVVFGKNYIVMK
jgi:hypothetical protein